jgi:GNAT superfamily N-acetyltransferase
MCEIVSTTVSAIWDDPYFESLVEEYAQESAIDGLPHPSAKRESYEQLEAAGLITPMAAYANGRLVGFVGIFMPIVPHYDARIATLESFFVGAAYRKSGAGLKLLRAAEHFAKENNAVGLLVSVPSGGRLAEVMPRLDYVESNQVFFRKLNDGSSTQH